MASQNVVGTTITANCYGIGPGGLTPSPTTNDTSRLMPAPITSVMTSDANHFTGCENLASEGGLPPQITTTITWNGTTQSM